MIAVTFVLGVLVIAAWWIVEGPAGCPVCGQPQGHEFDCPRASRRDQGWTDPLDDPGSRGRDEDAYLDGLIGESTGRAEP